MYGAGDLSTALRTGADGDVIGQDGAEGAANTAGVVAARPIGTHSRKGIFVEVRRGRPSDRVS